MGFILCFWAIKNGTDTSIDNPESFQAFPSTVQWYKTLYSKYPELLRQKINGSNLTCLILILVFNL